MKSIVQNEYQFKDEYSKREELLARCTRHIIGDLKSSWGKGIGKVERKPIIKEQQIVLTKYLESLIVNKRVASDVTVFVYIQFLCSFCDKVRKPFSQMNNEDIIKYFADQHRANASHNSIISRQMMLRRFFKWFTDEDKPKIMKGLEGRLKKRILDVTKLLETEDIKKMVEASDCNRNACLIMALYEGGLRNGELCNIKLEDVKYDDGEYYITVNGKTGKRTLLFKDSVPYLDKLLNEHPHRSNKQAPLFYDLKRRYKGLGIQAVYHIIKKVSNWSQVSQNKKVWPHLLRHSRAWHLVKYNNFNERDLRLFFGWSSTSDMPNHYLHYDEGAVYDKIRGRPKKKEEDLRKKTRLNPSQCSSCFKFSPATNTACEYCKIPFENQKRQMAEEAMNELFADEGFKEILTNYLKNKKNG
jgi:integrase/recombinase XerD